MVIHDKSLAISIFSGQSPAVLTPGSAIAAATPFFICMKKINYLYYLNITK